MVMAVSGLDPGIVPGIPINRALCPPDRDRRDEPGDDEHLCDAAHHHSRRTNSRPSSLFAHSTIGVLLRKDMTAGATTVGSALPSEATATTTSHSSLNATDSRRSFGLSSDAR